MKTLRTLIKDHRKQNDLSIRDAAKRIGMDYTSLWRFEQGKSLQEKQWTRLMAWIFTK